MTPFLRDIARPLCVMKTAGCCDTLLSAAPLVRRGVQETPPAKFAMRRDIEIRLGLLEATREGYSPISSKERAAETCPQIVWRPTSGPGGRFSHGRRPQVFEPRSLPFPAALEAYRFLGEGKNAASLKQV
jgi:hypothetical protein